MNRLTFRSGSFWALLLTIVVSATAGSAALDIYWTVEEGLPPASSRLVSIWDVQASDRDRVLERRHIKALSTLTEVFESVVPFGVVERALVGDNGIHLSVRGVTAGPGLADISGHGLLAADSEVTFPDASPRPVSLTVTQGLLEELQARIGHRIRIDGADGLIAKVVPSKVGFPTSAERFWHLSSGHEGAAGSGSQQTFLQVVGRLRPGVRPDTARSLVERHLGKLSGAIGLETFGQDQRRAAMPAVNALAAAAVALFVVGALVATSVAFTRVIEREHDLHLMTVLGAEPRHITRLVLRDVGLTGVLALPAVLVGVGATEALLRARTAHMGLFGISASIGPRALLAAVLVSCTLVLIVGLVVARRAAIVASGSSSGLGWSRQKLTVLLVAQSLVVTLLGTTAVLQARALTFAASPSFLGFETKDLEVVPLRLSSSETLPPNAAQGFMDAAEQFSRGGQAAIVSHLPLSGHDRSMSIRVPGTDQSAYISAGMRLVSSQFFSLVGVRIVAGDLSLATAKRTVIINTVMADTVFGPGQSVVGRSLVLGGRLDPEWEIVAVVAPFRHRGIFDAARPEVFVLYPAADTFVEPIRTHQLASAFLLYDSRSNRPGPATLFRDLADALPGFAAGASQSFDRFALTAAGPRPMLAASASLIAGAALGLMAIGLFGVMNTVMRQRTVELAVRCALGATPAKNAIASLRPVLTALTLGIVIGGAAAALGVGALGAFVPFPPDFDVSGNAAKALLLTAVAAYCGAVLAMLAPLSLTWRVNAVTALRRGTVR